MASLPSRIRDILTPKSIRSVVFEATQECNQECVFCYNVWKCADYPRGQLDTALTKDLLDRVIRDYRPRVLTFSGGEPLLRDDLVELVQHVSGRVSCNLISNGTLMTDDLAQRLVGAGVRVFEFTLLSADRDTHNSLVGRESFDQLIEGIASVRAAGGTVTTTFVAMKQNIAGLAEAIELSVALGAYWMLFNRFNVGGAGIAHAESIMPSVNELRNALAIADDLSAKYGIGISCGVPIPQCVLDTSPYEHVQSLGCAVGTRNSYPTVDPMGNVRWCNHSATIIGNVFDTPLGRMLKTDMAKHYASGVPDECVDCEHVKSCRGGCRAAAEVCGNTGGIDPFVCICNHEETRVCASNT